jgi:phosphoribosylformylglycinamidine cyclo-ligase
VGAVERSRVLTGEGVSAGDIVLGLASSGVHSNGFSLVRRIIADRQWSLADGLGDQLLTPTRIYVKSLLPVLKEGRVKALAHITGGGILENIPRVMPEGCHAVVTAASWTLPQIFDRLRDGGGLAAEEMVRTFNCGIGMALIVAPAEADAAAAALEAGGETVYRIGRIEAGERGCTVQGAAGQWRSEKDWAATHHG